MGTSQNTINNRKNGNKNQYGAYLPPNLLTRHRHLCPSPRTGRCLPAEAVCYETGPMTGVGAMGATSGRPHCTIPFSSPGYCLATESRRYVPFEIRDGFIHRDPTFKQIVEFLPE